jgi:predicted nucleic acid-binding protein
MAVVDASVIISAILPDDVHHQASKAWLDAQVNSGRQFSAPAIVLSEVAAPLSRAFNQPVLAKKIVQSLITAPFVQLVPISNTLAHRAAIIAADYQIRGCDAVYVALAEALGEELITLDKQQGERANVVVEVSHPTF